MERKDNTVNNMLFELGKQNSADNPFLFVESSKELSFLSYQNFAGSVSNPVQVLVKIV